MSTPEGKVKARVDRMLTQLGVWFFSPQAGPYGQAGIPDRIACVDGQFVGIEVKADRTKKPTRLQVQCMEKIEASGGRCFVVFDDASLDTARLYIMEVLGAGRRTGKGAGSKAE
jgi:hypothetical protein